MCYVVAHLFLEHTLWRTGYEDLVVLVSGMCLSSDGERSSDPAMVHDWAHVVGGRSSFNKNDAFIAVRAYLQNWYEIGPQEDIKRVIDAMAIGPGGEPLDREVSRDWDLSWQTVCENVATGNPFKTSLMRGIDANGNHGHIEWLQSGGMRFVQDDL